MNAIRSARCGAALLAIFTAAVTGCESTSTTTPALAPASSASHTVIPQVYTSGSQVMTWDAIPETVQPVNWAPAYCTSTPKVGRNANWANPHNAFVVGHPWENDYFIAPWINAWNTRESENSGNPLAPYYNWSRYSTQVQGNGSFVIRLLADNCSWVYLDGILVGVQGTNLSANSYGLTLNGSHTLEFIVFDGGGASGGKFKLETTTNPPPPLNPDLDDDGHPNVSDAFPLDPTEWADTDGDGVGDNGDAFPNDPSEQKDSDGDGVGDHADAYPNDPTRWQLDNTPPSITHTITGGTPSVSGWYSSNVTVTFQVTDAETAAATTGCDAQNVTATTGINGVTFTCSATSGGGTATDAVTIKLDKTIPTVSGAVTTGTLGTNGWYTDNVVVSWTPSAAGPSGQTPSPDCGNVTLTSDSPSTSFTCSVTTGAGISSAQGTVTVKRDATKPVLTWSGNAGSYSVDQSISIACSATDILSGVVSAACGSISGAAYTFALGVNPYSASASDKAGNVGTASGSFTVTISSGSVCTLVQRWVSNAGVANSMCVKLEHGDYQPFRNELAAQSGKKITEANAAILLRLVNAL